MKLIMRMANDAVAEILRERFRRHGVKSPYLRGGNGDHRRNKWKKRIQTTNTEITYTSVDQKHTKHHK